MMKKITLQLIAFLFLAVCGFQTQAQTYEEWTQPGKYTIGVPGQDLLMTINPGTGDLEWAAKLDGDDPTQVWAIVDHRTPASNGYMEIYATIPGVGNFTMCTTPENVSGKDIKITIRPGDPKSVDPLSGDLSGYDQFQRRKTPTNNGNNDALFIKVPGEGGSRYGKVPGAAGEAVMFDGGGIDKLEFKLVEALSTEDFDQGSVFVANPVDNRIKVSGLAGQVQAITVYSLQGAKVIEQTLSASATEISIDASALSTGMYILNFESDNGGFIKKIVKR